MTRQYAQLYATNRQMLKFNKCSRDIMIIEAEKVEIEKVPAKAVGCTFSVKINYSPIHESILMRFRLLELSQFILLAF